jgi:hypothetical protein
LYIDEGAGDWNDTHPWAQAQGNAWDTTGNGGQIPFSNWTSWIDNSTISNSVAYTWGGADTPFDFNNDLNDQRLSIQVYYNNNQPSLVVTAYSNNTPIWTELHPNPNPTWSALNQTTAPEDIWSNYAFGCLNDDQNFPNSYCWLVMGENNYYPYKPSFSSDEYVNSRYQAIDTIYSAGIDCTAFVQRAASYTVNGYFEMNDLADNRMPWGYTWPGLALEGMDGVNNASWPIAMVDSRIGVNDQANLNLLEPGDIISYYRETQNPDGTIYREEHAGIVCKVIYTADRIIDRNLTLIIESSGTHMRVVNERSLQFFMNRGNVYWGIRRFKHN